MHAGQDLADELIRRQVFDWHVTDERGAEKGLADGKYHLMLRIPADFSADLVTGPDPAADRDAAQLRVVSDDATNYLSGVFARTAFDEVRAAAAAARSAGYFDKMLIGFTDLKQQTEQAADGAAQAATTAPADASRGRRPAVRRDLTDAHDRGAGRLSGGLGTAAQGADDLAAGLDHAQRRRRRSSPTGTAQAAAGGRQLATAVDAAADKVEPLLRRQRPAHRGRRRPGRARRRPARRATSTSWTTRPTTRCSGRESCSDHLNGLPADTPGPGRR